MTYRQTLWCGPYNGWFHYISSLLTFCIFYMVFTPTKYRYVTFPTFVGNPLGSLYSTMFIFYSELIKLSCFLSVSEWYLPIYIIHMCIRRPSHVK